MRLKYIVGFFAVVLFLSTVSATAKIEIHTLPDCQIFVTEIDAYSGSSNTPVASPFSTFTGDEGKLVFDYTPKESIFKLGLLLKSDSGSREISYTVFDDLMHDGKKEVITFFEDNFSVEEMDIDVVEEESQAVVEENSSEVVSNESVEGGGITGDNIGNVSEEGNSTGVLGGILMHGNAIYQENKTVVNVLSYGVGIVILIVPLFFFFRKRLSKGFPSIGGSNNNNEDDFEKAETDLKNARARIDALKGKKLDAARQKLVDDERELMRLRNLGRD